MSNTELLSLQHSLLDIPCSIFNRLQKPSPRLVSLTSRNHSGRWRHRPGSGAAFTSIFLVVYSLFDIQSVAETSTSAGVLTSRNHFGGWRHRPGTGAALTSIFLVGYSLFDIQSI